MNDSTEQPTSDNKATAPATGYTGDTYCQDCGRLMASGLSIPISVSHDYYDAEMQVFHEINAKRAGAGMSPLTWNEGLYAGSKIRTQEPYEFIDLRFRKRMDEFVSP